MPFSVVRPSPAPPRCAHPPACDPVLRSLRACTLQGPLQRRAARCWRADGGLAWVGGRDGWRVGLVLRPANISLSATQKLDCSNSRSPLFTSWQHGRAGAALGSADGQPAAWPRHAGQPPQRRAAAERGGAAARRGPAHLRRRGAHRRVARLPARLSPAAGAAAVRRERWADHQGGGGALREAAVSRALLPGRPAALCGGGCPHRLRQPRLGHLPRERGA